MLVVVEREAACTEWMDHWGPQPETWALLEQEEGECSRVFADRMHLTLDRFSASATSLALVVFVLGTGMTIPSMSERLSRALTFLHHLARFPRGTLAITRGYELHPAPHRALRLLADELLEHGADVDIVVRGGETAAASQICAARPSFDPAPVAAISGASLPVTVCPFEDRTVGRIDYERSVTDRLLGVSLWEHCGTEPATYARGVLVAGRSN